MVVWVGELDQLDLLVEYFSASFGLRRISVVYSLVGHECCLVLGYLSRYEVEDRSEKQILG